MAETEVKAHIGFEVDDAPLKKLQEGIGALKEGLFGLTATLVESGFALYETVVKTAEAGEQAIKLGQQTGVGTQKIQELQFAAKQLGLETSELTRSLTFLNRNMFAVVTGGGGVNDIFMKMGITIQDHVTKKLRPAGDVLGDIAEKFKAMPEGAEKAGLATKFFGKQGATLIPLLNKGRDGIKDMGAEAQALGVVLSDKDAAAGMQFQESLKTLMAALTGIRNVVASDLMPAMTDIIHQMLEWFKANRKAIQSGLKEFLQATVVFLKAMLKTFLAVSSAIQGFTDIVGGAGNATKLLLFALGAVTSASILYGMGALIQAGFAAAKAFTFADAAALLIPIGIGLAIIAIGLLIEDIYTFMKGGDSLVGRLLSWFPEVVKTISGIIQPIADPIYAIIYGISNGVLTWSSLFKNLGILIVNVLLTPLRAVFELLGSAASLIGRVTGFKGLANLGSKVQDFGGNLALDASIPGSNSSPTRNSNANVVVNAPTTVTVPEGTPPGLVGDAVSTGVSNGVENHLRQAQRATGSQVAY